MSKIEGAIPPSNFRSSEIAFIGEPVDDRGKAAVEFASSHAEKTFTVTYDPVDLTVKLNDQKIISDYFELHLPNVSDACTITLEATTLGLPEIYLLLKAYRTRKDLTMRIVYVEPEQYKRGATGSSSNRDFELSDDILGYRPIPGAIIELNSRRLRRGIFFLGYEGERLERIFEDQKMIRSEDITVVFGVPAYQVGWEMEAILNNLETIKENNLGRDVRYCAADNPAAAYDVIYNVFESLDGNEQMFIAPIGTKPCGIGAALFAVQFRDRVGILYDHPRKKKSRTEKINAWHIFEVTADGDSLY